MPRFQALTVLQPLSESRPRGSSAPRAAVLSLAGLAILYAYAVARWGGVLVDWNACLIGFGLLAISCGWLIPRLQLAPVPDRWLLGAVWLLPVYIALQLVPLPVSLLKGLSPARAEIHVALAPLESATAFAPLSVATAATLRELARILGCSVVFLLVRQIAWRLPRRPWLPILPIVAVASLEAVLGLWQYSTGGPSGYAHGTYVARDHFAGLLEMSLPFAVLYPFAIRGRPAWKACLGIGSAVLILLGILYSLSRMGFAVSLFSLFVTGALALRTRLGKAATGLAVGALFLLLVLGAVFLPPDRLVERLGETSAADEVRPNIRLLMWRETLHLIAAYPVFGCGLGGYESAFAKYNLTVPMFRVDYAHNDYLQLLAELGVVGFCIAMALGLAILARGVRAIFRHSDPRQHSLALACTGALLAILLHSLVDFNLYNPANAFLLAWIAGISAALTFSSSAAPAQEHLPPARSFHSPPAFASRL